MSYQILYCALTKGTEVKYMHIVTIKDEQVSEVTRSANIDKTARIFRHRVE
jgi:hypothetical protein